jgi:WD40 repeat protein
MFYAVAFLPDGQLAVVVPARAVRVRGGAALHHDRERRVVRELGRHAAPAVGVAFHGDELYSAGADGVRSWRIPDGRSTAIAELSGPFSTFAYDPTLALAAAARPDGRIELWRPATGEHRTLYGHGREVKALAFDPSHRLLASGGWDGLRLWRLDRGDTIAIAGHSDGIYGVAFDPVTGLLASAAVDRTVRVIDPELALTSQRTRHVDRVHSVAFSADGELIASTGADRSVRLWHTATGASRRLTETSSSISSVCFDPMAPIVYVTGADGSLKQVDFATGEERNLALPGQRVSSFTVNATWLASIVDQRIELRRRDEPTARPLAGQTDAARYIALGDHDHLATIGRSGELRWWDLASGGQRLLADHIEPRSLAIDPSDRWVAVGGADRTVQLINVDDSRRRYSLAADAASVWVARFARDGRTLEAIGDDDAVSRWQIDDSVRSPVKLPPFGQGAGANALDVGQQGLVATSSDQETVRVWRGDGSPQWHAPALLPMPAGSCFYAPALTPEQHASARLAAVTALIRDPADRRSVACATAALSPALRACLDDTRQAVRASPDRRTIAVACLGGIEVFSVATQQRVLRSGVAPAFALTDDGLLSLSDRHLRWRDFLGSPEVELLADVDAIGAGDRVIAAVQRDRVIELEPRTGRMLNRIAVETKVTAVAFDRGSWFLGTAESRVVVWSPGAGTRHTLAVSGAAPVTAVSGDGDLVAIGYADGRAAITSLTEDQLLWSDRLHGEIATLDFEPDVLLVATGLGDTHRVALTAFRADWCTILHEVIERSPATWVEGRPRRRGLPERHPCS